MHRTYAITGSASGIGEATKAALEQRGDRVIGADLHHADIVCDLTSPTGRAALVAGVAQRLDGDPLDGVMACAGIAFSGASEETAARIDHRSPDATIQVNFFGAVATLEGLRPSLVAAPHPRAAVIASTALLQGADEPTIAACLAGDEAGALAAASALSPGAAYATSKRALARWVRREAPSSAWAGARIPLNAIAPGPVTTNINRAYLERASPESLGMPLRGPGSAEDIATCLIWLTDAANTLMTGQVIFVDGGLEASTRPHDVW